MLFPPIFPPKRHLDQDISKRTARFSGSVFPCRPRGEKCGLGPHARRDRKDNIVTNTRAENNVRADHAHFSTASGGSKDSAHFACISHSLMGEDRDRPATASLRLLGTIGRRRVAAMDRQDCRSLRRAPRTGAPRTHFVSSRGEKCRLDKIRAKTRTPKLRVC